MDEVKGESFSIDIERWKMLLEKITEHFLSTYITARIDSFVWFYYIECSIIIYDNVIQIDYRASIPFY